jgi:hypothetical protein
MKMRLLGDRVSRRTAWQIARQHDWDTLQDAEYLAVTRLQADALGMVDPRLAAAAGTSCRSPPSRTCFGDRGGAGGGGADPDFREAWVPRRDGHGREIAGISQELMDARDQARF